MKKIPVNLTLTVIYAEVDQALEDDRYCVQSELNSISHLCPDLCPEIIRQEIVNYALRRIRCRYRLIDEVRYRNNLNRGFSKSLEECLKVETVVRQGIHHLIHKMRLEAISPVSITRSAAILPTAKKALTPQL
jgi:hypothetical protein